MQSLGRLLIWFPMYRNYYEEDGDIFIGSSNMSSSGLTSGIEWNYRLNKNKNLEDFAHFKNIFEDLFLNHSIIIDDNEMKRYSAVWKRPKIFNDLEKAETSFKNIRPNIKTGFFSGTNKESNCEVVFATVQTQCIYSKSYSILDF